MVGDENEADTQTKIFKIQLFVIMTMTMMMMIRTSN